MPDSRCITSSRQRPPTQARCRFRRAGNEPQGAGRGIVKRFNWYPGIDAEAVKAQLDDATAEAVRRRDATDLASKGKPFPIAPYFNDILESYERKVQ